MPIINNFTQDSDYPAISRVPSKSVSFEAPAKNYAAYASETIVKNITIPAVNIVQPVITQYQFAGLASIFTYNMQYFNVMVKAERTSATNVRVTWSIYNKTSVQRAWNGNTYRVDLMLFNIV